MTLDNDEWWIQDKGSRNGTYVNGRPIERVRLTGRAQIQLARGGPIVKLSIESEDEDTHTVPGSRLQRPRTSIQDYIQHYLNTSAKQEPAGDKTMMIRRAFATLQATQRRRYRWWLASVFAAAVVLAGYVAVQRANLSAENAARQQMAVELERQRQAPAQLFDAMKELELQIAQLKSVVEGSGHGQLSSQLRKLEESRRRMAKRYEGYIEELGTYRELNPDEREIYRIARVFNESEFGMPSEFVKSVQETIRDYWRTRAGQERFLESVKTAERNHYTPYIVKTMQKYGLPVQFFYLALQESNCNLDAIGPHTRWGRAKGMWQFIPQTATAFGLDPGPYANRKFVDRNDERHDFEKSTAAAARYLQSIYSTLAQASGLLVIASYNWGEHRVVEKLHTLAGPYESPKEAMEGIPEDPRERNYWRFLGEYSRRMPRQTKEYVLKVFAAAVIGENPRLFGFDIDNPLEPYMEAQGTDEDT